MEKKDWLLSGVQDLEEDFENAVNMLSNKKIQNRFKSIIFEDNVIRSTDDIHRFFKTDLNTPFKTVAKWEI